MLIGLMRRPHHLRVLNALRSHGPQRFNDLKKRTGLQPTQLSRVLGELTDQMLVLMRTIGGTDDQVILEYRASRRGGALMEHWDAFHGLVHAQNDPLAQSIDHEMEQLIAAQE